MNRFQLEHIIRAASAISEDADIIIVGSQAIHASVEAPPDIVVKSVEADVYPRSHPERSQVIDGSIGELSAFHDTFGYYAQGVSPETAILPEGWEERLVPLSNENTRGGTGWCLDLYDLMASKYAANREKDRVFTRAVISAGLVEQQTMIDRVSSMPVSNAERDRITDSVEADFTLVAEASGLSPGA